MPRRPRTPGPHARPTLDALEARALLATFTVTSLADAIADDGLTTLREAVALANAAGGDDQIVFDAALPAGTLTLTQGQIDVTDTLAITGPGRAALTIDAGDLSRVFGLTAPATITDMTLTRGLATDAGGGAIVATSGLTLERVTIRDSLAPLGASPTSEGGAILVAGDATLRDVTLENNSSERSGGALAAIGDESATLVLERVEAFGNDALLAGGAIVVTGYGSVTIADSTFTGNTATARGGAARIQANAADITGSTFDTNTSRTSHGGHLALDAGAITVTDSSFNAGRADTEDADDGRGGAIDALSSLTSLVITGSTFTANEADLGGAIYTYPFGSAFDLATSTFTSNDADEGGALYLADGTGSGLVDRALFATNIARLGAAVYAADSLEVFNSTFSANTARRDGGALYIVATGVAINYSTIAFNRADTSNSGTGSGGGVFASTAFDLLSSIVALNYRGSSGQTADAIDGTVNASFSLTGDTDPALESLADNGGPTLTHALRAESPAVAAGPTDSGLVDQRNQSRPESGPIDIGAFQHFAPVIDTLSSPTGSAPRAGTFTASATATDPDGSDITIIDFYLDLNSNGTIDDGELISTDDNPEDGFSAQIPTTGFTLGQTLRFFAIANDSHGFSSQPAEQVATVVNSTPVIGSLTSSSPALVGGASVTITAAEVTDADGTALLVRFYLDSDNDGNADDPEQVSTDSTPDDGFTLVLSADDVPLGPFTILAIAEDNDGSEGQPASLDLVRGERPVIGSVEILTSRPMQGRELRLAARDITDPDAESITVRVYADRNLDGIADATELVGSAETAPGGDATITLTPDAVDSIDPGTITLLFVATDEQGAPSETTSLELALGFDTRAGIASALTGIDTAGVHRAIVINGYGAPVLYEQTSTGWRSLRLDLAAGLLGLFEPISFSGGVEVWTDPKDGLTYAAATTPTSLYLFARDAAGTWTARDLAELDSAAAISGTLTRFTSTDGLVSLAGFTADGRLVAFSQTGATDADGFVWAFTDVSAQTGSNITALDSLTSYVTAWNQWSIVGLDDNGDIQNFWFIPGAFDTWRLDNLSDITGAPQLAGGLSPILTSWQGINLTALDAEGNLLVTWWVPDFAGEWRSDDLTAIAGGPTFADGAMASYYTSWDGMNYAGLDDDGNLTVYWWVPATNAWTASPLAEIDTEPSSADRQGPVRFDGHAADDGTLSVFLIDGLSTVQRVWWQPGQGATWTIDNLTDAPSV